MGPCSPSDEEKVASNVLTLLSSNLWHGRESRDKGSKQSVQKSSAAFCSSSGSMVSQHMEAKQQLESFDKVSTGAPQCENCDDDGDDYHDDDVHGDCMKPLTSLDINMDTISRHSMQSHYSHPMGLSLASTLTQTKVQSTSRFGQMAKHRTIAENESKENGAVEGSEKMQAFAKQHKGYRHKSLGHGGNASALKMSRLATMVSKVVPLDLSATHIEVKSSGIQTFSTSKEDQFSAKLPQGCSSRTSLYREAKSTISPLSSTQGLNLLGEAACLDLKTEEDNPTMSHDSQEKKSYLERLVDNGISENFSKTKGQLKPPTYPKTRHVTSSSYKKKGKHQVAAAAVDNHCMAICAGSESDSGALSSTQTSATCQPTSLLIAVKIEDSFENSCWERENAAVGRVSSNMNLFHYVSNKIVDSHNVDNKVKNGHPAKNLECHIKSSNCFRQDDISTAGSSQLTAVKQEHACYLNKEGLSNSTVQNKKDSKASESNIKSSNTDTVSETASVKVDSHSGPDKSCEALNIVKCHLASNTSELEVKRLQEKQTIDCPSAIMEPFQKNLNKNRMAGLFEYTGPNFDPQNNRDLAPKSCTDALGASIGNKTFVSAVGVPANCLSFGSVANASLSWQQQGNAHSQNICTSLPRARRGRQPKKSNFCPRKKEIVNKFARVCAPSGLLGSLNPGIINRLRDKTQVHAVLAAVIGSAPSCRAKGDPGQYQDIQEEGRRAPDFHDPRKERSPKRRRSTDVQGLVSGGASQPKTALHNSAGGVARPTGHVKKQEERDADWVSVDVRQCENALETTDTGGSKFMMQLNCIQSEDGGRQPQLIVNDEPRESSKSSTAVCTAANVASCWLELLRLDIKGRLSALKRSRRRVRSVVISGQLDEKLPPGVDLLKRPLGPTACSKELSGTESQMDETEQWRSFFLHMDGLLSAEGARLESWLSQIVEMQSHCQNNQSYLPRLDMAQCVLKKEDKVTRTQGSLEGTLAMAATAASIFSTANLATTMEIKS